MDRSSKTNMRTLNPNFNSTLAMEEPNSPSSASSSGLPPYSGPSAVSPTAEGQKVQGASATSIDPRYIGLPKLDYSLYSPPLFKLSTDLKVLSSKAECLSTNAGALSSLVRAQSMVPPKPQLQVRGSRGSHVDFDIRINLMNILVPSDERNRMEYISCVGDGEVAYRGGMRPGVLPEVGDSGLEGWCCRFIEDPTVVKSFALERVVTNLDVGWIEGQLRRLVASLNYRGVVDISLLMTHSTVLVQSPDKIGRFFTDIAGLFTANSGKSRYEVVKSVWPFATAQNGEPGRKCIVQSEEEWWAEWKDAIKHVISRQRHCCVTVEDKLESAMEAQGNEVDTVDWGYDYWTC